MSLGTAEKSIKNSVSLDLVSYDIPECGATAQFSVVQLESGALCCLVSYSSSSSGELSMAELHPLPPPTRAPMRVRSTSNLAAQFTGKL